MPWSVKTNLVDPISQAWLLTRTNNSCGIFIGTFGHSIDNFCVPLNNPKKTVKLYRIGNCIIENPNEVKQITLENNRKVNLK